MKFSKNSQQIVKYMLYYKGVDQIRSKKQMRLLKTAVCGVLAAACVASIVGCSFGTNGEDGKDGKNGKSAYEIAVDHGFVGTEQEWLDSLKADNTSFSLDDLYESAQKNGYTGSYLDFLKEYLNASLDGTAMDNSANINRALLSVVSVFAEFTKTQIIYGPWGQSQETTSSYTSAGSGVIYEKEGGDAYIVTNYHVVYDADSNTGVSPDIYCYLYGMEPHRGPSTNYIACTYVGGSLNYDLAVLKVTDSDILKSSDARAVQIADSNEIAVGEAAITIGNPAANGISVASGIVSVDSEYITMKGADKATSVTFRVMRTDASINEGNSGGGLFNAEGKLIGIVNAKMVTETVEGIGYAIPSTLAKYVVENIIDHCDGEENLKVKKALIGIEVSTYSSKSVYDEAAGIARIEEQVRVEKVTEGSIGQGVVKAGDIIVSLTIDGETHPITRRFQVVDLMLTVRSGDTVVLRVLRDGKYEDLTFQFTDEYLSVIN